MRCTALAAVVPSPYRFPVFNHLPCWKDQDNAHLHTLEVERKPDYISYIRICIGPLLSAAVSIVIR